MLSKIHVAVRRFFQRIPTYVHYYAGRSDASQLQNLSSVCVLLGPYRNITTLTTTILHMHPQCQALNHAGVRLFHTPVDFFLHPIARALQSFCSFVLKISQSGRRSRGGSILYSHAVAEGNDFFDLYQKMYGDSMIKEDIRSIIWKESMRLTNHVRNNGVDLAERAQQFPQLRFLYPVRNPLDCALSNIKTGLYRKLTKDDSPEAVLIAILDTLVWFCDLQKQAPTQSMLFFEHSIDEALLHQFQEFLGLEHSEQWCSGVMQAFSLRSNYEHEPAFVELYRSQVEQKFAAYPEVQQQLLRFLDS